MPLDMVKYSFGVQKLLHYTTQHEGGRHIDFRQSLGKVTTVTRLSAYMSSRALATNTTSIVKIEFCYNMISGVARPLAARCGCQICRRSIFGDRLLDSLFNSTVYIFLCCAMCSFFNTKTNKHEWSLRLTFFHVG